MIDPMATEELSRWLYAFGDALSCSDATSLWLLPNALWRDFVELAGKLQGAEGAGAAQDVRDGDSARPRDGEVAGTADG